MMRKPEIYMLHISQPPVLRYILLNSANLHCLDVRMVEGLSGTALVGQRDV
jgi:hypothetical protein